MRAEGNVGKRRVQSKIINKAERSSCSRVPAYTKHPLELEFRTKGEENRRGQEDEGA
ncbi:putative metabolite transport protein YyaJ [Clarias magur]|uniref:Putative metabolite transport protein YyaJ n=1 Tax=Clarias magur TaxID=1594786 RepID=A0A8J4U5U4_CLAMG|nr:putative metabolite transport protein YyaJ [Clarias magur]